MNKKIINNLDIFLCILNIKMDYNSNVLNLNRQIEQLNLESRLKQADKVAKARAEVQALKQEDPVRQLETTAETGFGVATAKARPLIAVGKVIKGAPKAIDEGLNIASDLIDPSDSVFRNLKGTYPTSTIEDVVSSLKGDVAVGKTIAERSAKYGRLLYDVVSDIDQGKIVGKNADERRSNILGIASGTLEGIGTALDVTGVGAPVGVAFNILGGLTGIAGGVEDIIGEAEEPKQAEQKLKTEEQTKAPQQKLLAVQDIGSTGAIVKQAQS
jgi:hypothetical protein